jgi:uncharacterized protein (DUF4415 family)
VVVLLKKQTHTAGCEKNNHKTNSSIFQHELKIEPLGLSVIVFMQWFFLKQQLVFASSVCAKPTNGRYKDMGNKKLNPKDLDNVNPEWTISDFDKAVRFSSLPEALQHKLRGQRGLQKSPKKIQTSVRYDADIVEAFKSKGSGWQTRMNNALRDWLKMHHA